MKTVFKNTLALCAFLLCITMLHAQTDASLSFKVRTSTANGQYAPKHVLAIWVETSAGTFKKSFKVMAQQRIQYLYTWKAASSFNTTDAITGATLQSHQLHTITWNCHDLSNNLVPDGDYRIRVEFTEKDAQGLVQNYAFTKNSSSQVINYPDNANFKDAVLNYNVVAGIPVTENPDVTVYPNPFTDAVVFELPADTRQNIQIYNNTGKLVFSSSDFSVQNGKSTLHWDTMSNAGAKLCNGVYYYKISSGQSTVYGKLLKTGK